MDFRNFNFCRPADNKFQNPFRMMSTSTSPCVDITMVPLNSDKLAVSAPQDFTPAKTVFKTATLKCHQPSVTIGGFVGSKSQTRSYINNRNQLYDVLICHLTQIPDLLKYRPYMLVDRCFIASPASPQLSSSQKPKKTDVINPVEEPSTSEVPNSGTDSISTDHPKVPEVRSYADVAKMPGAKGDCMRAKLSPIRRFQQNARDKGRPRSIQGNWRERESIKDIRRDKEFVTKKSEDSYKHKSNDLSHKESAKNSGQLFRNFKLSGKGGNSCNKRSFQSNKRGEGSKNRIVHEKHPNFSKNSYDQSAKCTETDLESGGCSNWRCRQPHAQKTNPRHELRQRIGAEIREYTPPRSLGCFIKQLPIRVMEKINPSQSTTYNSAANLKEKCTEAFNSIRDNTMVRNLARLGCSPRDQRKDSTSSEEVVFRASECDSEDSFVLFTNEDLPDSSDSSDSSESDWSELEECSVLSPWLTQVNRKWDLECGLDVAAGSSPKKVKFEEVAVIHPMVTWEFAYRNARCGPWEEMARDRERFRLRVSRVEPIISPILSSEHRENARRRMSTLQPQ